MLIKYARANFSFFLFGIFGLLQGCGTRPPEIGEVWESTQDLEYRVLAHIVCELKTAVIAVRQRRGATGGQINYLLPDSWGVQETVTFEVDEKFGLSPGLSLVRPFEVTQTFTLGLGADLSAQASRIDKFNFFYPVSKLAKPLGVQTPDNLAGSGYTACLNDRSGSSPLLIGDLGIKDWLNGALDSRQLLASSAIDGKHLEEYALTYNIKFDIATNGKAAPSWQLIRATVNGGSDLFTGERKRHHELLLTFSPSAAGNAFEPAPGGASLHFTSQIGSSVQSGALR